MTGETREKAAIIFGTRPEAIKLAPLILLFKETKCVDVEVVFTGQHREMVKDILPLFGIVPDEDLNLMTDGQSLAGFGSLALTEIDKYILRSKPDFIFVQGDTGTVLMSALAAVFNKIRVFHIEAGLRTNQKYSPFPEEINRILTTRLADYHVAPTESAKRNLLAEGVPGDRICLCGNTGIDSVTFVKRKIEEGDFENRLNPEIKRLIARIGNNFLLLTAHRRESFDGGLEDICNAILNLVRRFPNLHIIYPVHLNPRVQVVVKRSLIGHERIHLFGPLAYVDFIYLMMNCTIILTDSGGVQEEAPSFGKPILVLRENTERPEGIEAGCAKLVGTDQDEIIRNVTSLLEDDEYYQTFRSASDLYGDGNASRRILDFFLSKL